MIKSNRPDGRTKNLEIRKATVKLGVLKNANGSSRFCMGNTRVLAGVFGPAESGSSKRSFSDKGLVQVVVRPLFGTKTSMERYSESAISSVLLAAIDLDRLIHTSITVVVQPQEDDGGLLSCSMNAVMCAILDAGIPCKFTFLSISLIHRVCQLPNHSQTTEASFQNYTLDPINEEVSSCEFDLDQSAYLSCTLDIHSGSLVQLMPEYILVVQPNNTIFNAVEKAGCLPSPICSYSVLSRCKFWESTLELIDASSACCKILEAVVREAFETHLSKIISLTVSSNNIKEQS